MNPALLLAATGDPHFTTVTAMLGAGSFAVMGVAIFATEQVFASHAKVAVACLFVLGLVHIAMKTSGAPLWY